MSDAQLLKEHFESLVSQQLSRESGKPVPFVIGEKGMLYRRSLAILANLLATVEYDLEFAKEIMSELFNNPRFSFKTRNTVSGLIPDWDTGHSIVSARRLEAQEREQQRQIFEEYKDEMYRELFSG